MSQSFKEALILQFPNDRVVTDPEQLFEITKNSTGRQKTALALVRVIDENEILNLLKLASQFKVTVYPMSTGKNWGYGSKSPYVDQSLIIDMSLMNKIINFYPETGVVTLEPGVTQEQLYQFLSKQKIKYLVPTTGAGPETSLLANALEHGFGLTPQTDHCLAILSLQSILPNGERYQSHFYDQGAIDLDNHFKWSIGPYYDGLFTQSNLGIVTQMSIELKRTPSYVCAFFFTLKDNTKIEDFTKITQEILHLYGPLIGGINLFNDLRVLSMNQKSPSTRPLSDDEIKKLSKRNGLNKWSGTGTLYIEKEMAKAIKKRISKKLKPYCSQFVFIDENKLKLIFILEKIIPSKILSPFSQLIHKVKEAMEIFNGKPSFAAIPLVRWRSQSQQESNNPDDFDYGLIWYAPMMVYKSELINDFVNECYLICRKHNLDPLITFTAFNPRVLDVTIPLLFSREDTNQINAAHACYLELYEMGKGKGILPYRMGIQGLSLIQNSNFWNFHKKIKNCLDPENILAPRNQL